ncbi:MAG: YdcF family protein [Candidatus Sungbacteria bacterium]|uniref:YdcF family protein n=1 Tax=Candidatus Sungiibacteriota bacterium TaxID=2750080 RepID=A0A932VPS1_9BACT|nr:YdcF family protein [Candidatus Sungbacteria bacterium]
MEDNEHSVWALAQIIWDYHGMNHKLERADAIFVLCSYDTVVAEYGTRLFLEGWAPLLIFSGGRGGITKNLFPETEADIFKEIAVRRGVPQEKILVESESTNTGENILFTKRLLEKYHKDPQKFILVQKPYMERRAYATFRKLWPEKNMIVTSPQIPMRDYVLNHSNKNLSEHDIISIMVGDLQRVRVYPEKGFQIYQEIPSDVWKAYEALVSLGYTKYLL